MTPIQWLVSPPTTPATEPPSKEKRGRVLYVLRNNGQHVQLTQHKREFDDAVLECMVQIGEMTCATEIAESLPRGIFTTSGRAHQAAEVLQSLRRLDTRGCVWRDGKVWGVE